MNPSSWVVSTLSGSREGYVDGDTSKALFRGPSSFAYSPQGNLYVADRTNHAIRKVNLETRKVTTLCNQGLEQPVSIVWHPDGYFLVADRGSHLIRKVTTLGDVSTFTGTIIGFADGQPASARFSSPTALCVTPEGSVFVSDLGNDRIRLVAKDGSVTTYAGSRGGYADGPCEKALFFHPWDICLSSYGEIYVCDWGNNLIRLVDTYKRVVTTIKTKNADSPLSGSPNALNCPISLVLTPQYDLLVADRNNHRIRYLRRPNTLDTATPNSASTSSSSDPSVWEMTTFSGSVAGVADGNCATEAQFKNLLALAWSPSGQLLISSNDCIRVAEQVEKKGDKLENTDLSTSLGVLLDDGACSDFSFASTSTGRVFALHRPILIARCGSLLNAAVWQDLEKLNLEDDAWDAFWHFLYLDRLPATESVVGFEQHWALAIVYCDLFILAHICRLESLEKYCESTAKKLFATAQLLHTAPEDHSILEKLLESLTLRNVNAHHPIINLTIDILIEYTKRDAPKVVSLIGSALRGKFELQESCMEYLNRTIQTLPPLPIASSSIVATGALTSQPQNIASSTATAPLRVMASPTGSLFTQLSSMCPLNPEEGGNSTRKIPVDPDYAVIVDGASFPCHKSVLYARWPYFRFMMTAGLAEASDGAATLPGASDDGLSPAALRALLWFFYSDRPTLFTHATGLELLACASRFRFSDLETNLANPGFEELLKYCAIPIHLTPTKDNAVSLYKLAVRYDNAEMRKISSTTIVCNLPAIFSDSKLKEEFEQIDIGEKYQLLQESFSKLLHSTEQKPK